MPLDDFIEEKKNQFQKAYEQVYKDILPSEVLQSGNKWFNTFISLVATEAHLNALSYARQIIEEEITDESTNWNQINRVIQRITPAKSKNY